MKSLPVELRVDRDGYQDLLGTRAPGIMKKWLSAHLLLTLGLGMLLMDGCTPVYGSARERFAWDRGEPVRC